MPNHITQQLTATGSEKDLDTLQDLLQQEEDGNFCQALIPMPKVLESSEANAYAMKDEQALLRLQQVSLANGDVATAQAIQQALDNIRATGHGSWYSWCVENWGTKWGAYETQVSRIGLQELYVQYLTAWNPCLKVIRALSAKFPGVTFKMAYADEDLGYNCGFLTYEGGTLVGRQAMVDGSMAAYEFAFEIHGVEPEDIDMVPDFENDTYNYEPKEEC